MSKAAAEVLEALGKLTPEDVQYANDECIRRYLAAVNGDVKKATTQLKGTLEWRKIFKPDQILTPELEQVILKEKHYLAGCSTDGNPVLITRKRVRRLLADEEENYIRYLIYTAEKGVSLMTNNQSRWIWILDLKGYTSSNSPRLALTLKVVKLLADHYPERLKRAYIVDAPKVFYILYKMVYPFLDQPTRDKTCFVYSSQYSSSSGHLLTGKEDLTQFDKYYAFYSKEHDPSVYLKKLKDSENDPSSNVHFLND